MSRAEEVEMTTRVLAPYIKILPSCASRPPLKKSLEKDFSLRSK